MTVFLVVTFILPRLNFINDIMNISGIRSYDVTLHIKEPYHTIFNECGIPLSNSPFGKEYQKIENANIDLQNVGKNIVINTSHVKNGCKNVIIPKLNDNIFVINKREKS